MTISKIQFLLIQHLLKYGQIELVLPDGVKVEIGLTQEDEHGKVAIKDNYCWVISSRHDRSTSLDAYNMGLRFPDNEKSIVLEDRFDDADGLPVRRIDIA